MNKKKAGELLGRFWAEMPELVELDENIYYIDYFIEWLYDEGFEIAPIEFVNTKSNVGDKKIIDDCVFPDKIAMKKALKWHRKLTKAGILYESRHINVPIKRKKSGK